VHRGPTDADETIAALLGVFASRWPAEESGRPRVAICTQGTRDRCCAKWGFAAHRQALRLFTEGASPFEPLECSHLGGDRYAATGVFFPSGSMYAYLDSADLPALIGGEAEGRITPANYRGRVFEPELVQVLRGGLARDGHLQAAAAPITLLDPDDGGRVVHVSLDGGASFAVRLGEVETTFYASCANLDRRKRSRGRGWSTRRRAALSAERARRLRCSRPHGRPLLPPPRRRRAPPRIDDEAFAAAFDRFADAAWCCWARPATGTSEFYRARAAITRRLVERHGFNVIGLEADWPDAAALDRRVRGRDGPKDGAPFNRFPTWMWRNREMAAFVEDLRTLNARRPFDQRAEIRGLDLYSLNSSITAVLEHLDTADPDAAQHARARYGCLRPWSERPELYGAEVMRTGRTCEAAVVTQLMSLLTRELERGGADEADFDAQQNARVIQAAETYYRAMYWGSVESWNLRDRHMFDTLQQVLGRRGPEAKAVVWAHNSHIGDARATQMGEGGEWNIGQLCRQWWDDQAVLIGFSTDRGQVAAADDWGGAMRVKQVRPSMPGSWERTFLDAATPAPSPTGVTVPSWPERSPKAGSNARSASSTAPKPSATATTSTRGSHSNSTPWSGSRRPPPSTPSPHHATTAGTHRRPGPFGL
jgi:erythromycin esterase-like protein